MAITSAADVAMVGTLGGAKVVQLGLKTAGAVNKAGRVGRLAEKLASDVARYGEIGIKAESLVNPLSKADKLRNFSVRTVMAGNTEGLENISTESGATNPDYLNSYGQGVAAGLPFGFIPLGFHVIKKVTDGPFMAAYHARVDSKFAENYNAAMAGVKGFVAITPDQAATARTFVNPKAVMAQQAKLAEVQTRLSDPTRNVEAPIMRAKALKALDQVATDIATQNENAVAAVQEIGALPDPVAQSYWRGISKVGTGNADQLTANERAAVGGAKTPAGQAIFEETKLPDGTVQTRVTTEGMAHIKLETPAVGELVRSPEGDALYDANYQVPTTPPTNQQPHGQSLQGQTGAQAIAQNPQAQAGNAPAAAGVGIGGTAAATVGQAGQEAGPIINPAQPSPVAVPVIAPVVAGHPVAIARAVAASVEASVPSLQGRVKVADHATHRSGGVFVDLDGSMTVSPRDIAADMKVTGEKDPTGRLVELAIRHEVLHVAQVGVLRSRWEAAGSQGAFKDFFFKFYAGELARLQASNPAAVAAARSIYGEKMWDAMETDGHKGAELFRILTEGEINGEVTDLARELANGGATPGFIQLLKDAIKVITDLIATKRLPEAARQHVAALETLYRELTAPVQATVAPVDTATETKSPVATAEPTAASVPVETNAGTNPTVNDSLTVQPTPEVSNDTPPAEQPAAPAGKPKSYRRTVDSPRKAAFKAHELIQEIGGNLVSKSRAAEVLGKERMKIEGNLSQWNGAKALGDPTFNMIYARSGGETPNVMAERLYRKNLISAPTPDAMWDAIREVANGARKIGEAEKVADTHYQNENKNWTDEQISEREAKNAADAEKSANQGMEFDAVNEPGAGRIGVPVDELQVGEKIHVDGEEMTVAKRHPDGTIELQDGSRFGKQVFHGAEVYVEMGEGFDVPHEDIAAEVNFLVDEAEAKGYTSPDEYAAADPTGFEQSATAAENAHGPGTSAAGGDGRVSEGSRTAQGGTGSGNEVASRKTAMDAKNLAAAQDFGGNDVKLTQDTIVDPATLAAEKAAAEEAKAQQDKQQLSMNLDGETPPQPATPNDHGREEKPASAAQAQDGQRQVLNEQAAGDQTSPVADLDADERAFLDSFGGDSLMSSPASRDKQTLDLFDQTARNAPQDSPLSRVKVEGTKNALGAYKALTAKREKLGRRKSKRYSQSLWKVYQAVTGQDLATPDWAGIYKPEGTAPATVDTPAPVAKEPLAAEMPAIETGTPDSKPLPEGVFQDVIDSIDKEVDRAMERRDNLQLLNNRMNERSREIPGSFVTGRSNQHKGLMKQREGMNNRMSKAFDQLQDAEKKLRELQQKRRGYASGEFHENGQPRANSPSRKEAAKAVGSYGDYIRATVKKGDIVTFTMNPTPGGSRVARVNQKTISLEGGTSWSFDHVMPWKDGREMSKAELKEDIKAWRERETETPEKAPEVVAEAKETAQGVALMSAPASGAPAKYDAEKIKDATSAAREEVAASPVEKLRSIGRAWLEIGKRDDAHQLGKRLTATTIRGLIGQLPDGITGIKVKDNGKDSYGVQRWDITAPKGRASVIEEKGMVWVDVSGIGGPASYIEPNRRDAAGAAPAIYQVVEAYARNNGLEFIPDPSGVTPIATFRRWSQMLSSATRFGDTSHISPDGMVPGRPQIPLANGTTAPETTDIPGWTKGGDVPADVGRLAMAEYAYVKKWIPEIESLQISPDGTTVLGSDGHSLGTDPGSAFEGLLSGGRDPRVTGIGPATLLRAVITRMAENGTPPDFSRSALVSIGDDRANLFGEDSKGGNDSVTLLRSRESGNEARGNLATDSLYSAPAASAPTIPWDKMNPLFRSVFAANLQGVPLADIAKQHQIGERGVNNILNQINTRMQAMGEVHGLGGLEPAMSDGLLEPGRPERAMSASVPDVARLLQIREANGDPDVIANAETYAAADAMIAADRQGTVERIINRRANGESLTLDETAAAQMLMLEQVGHQDSMTEAQKLQMAWLAMDWIEQGTDDARRLQIRRDVTHSPAERAALYFTKELYTPQDKQTLAAIRNAKGRAAKEDVLKRFLERSEGLRANLLKQGIDIDASLKEFARQQAERAATVRAVAEAHGRLTGSYQADVDGFYHASGE